jgi:hypothetical protein
VGEVIFEAYRSLWRGKRLQVGTPVQIRVGRGEDSPCPQPSGTLVVVEKNEEGLFTTVKLSSSISKFGAQLALTNEKTLIWTGRFWHNEQDKEKSQTAEYHIVLDCPEHLETVQRTTHRVGDEILEQVVWGGISVWGRAWQPQLATRRFMMNAIVGDDDFFGEA